MKRHIKVTPKNIAATKIISSSNAIIDKRRLEAAIYDNNLIATAIDWANDLDYNWEYNTPESFAEFAKEQLISRVIPEYLENKGYRSLSEAEIEKLLSNRVLADLYEEASSGDFDAYF